MSDISIPWASEAARERVQQIQAASEPGTAEDLERASRAVQAHIEAMDDNGLVLYAGTNAMIGAVAAAHDVQLGVRPSLGDPAEKVQPGLEHLEILEVLTTRAVAATMRAEYADVRVPSATLANLAVYAGLTPVGATIAALPQWAGGHFSHHRQGAAGIRGHRIVELPYDVNVLDVDVAALPDFIDRQRPALVIVGGTLMLFPHRLEAIVEVTRAFGVPVLYDASHVAGLIAGRRFQQPLDEGVDVVTFSTYKSYGGPPGGAIATRDPDVAERVFAAVYPGLTANFDAGRLRALGIAAGELLSHGADYSARCIGTAQALGQALVDRGLQVTAADRGFTRSHHLAITLPDAAGAGSAVGRLARAGIYVSATTLGSQRGPVPALRLGTQELVRRGFTTGDMPELAELIARVLTEGGPPADVRPAVATLRQRRVRVHA
jgi:glycine hydroxymethyltransferase